MMSVHSNPVSVIFRGAALALTILVFVGGASNAQRAATQGSASSEGPFGQLAGSWSGSGTIDLSNGRHEPIKCRASYDVLEEQNKLQLNIHCASDSYNFDLRGSANYSGGTITGTWSEASRNAAGTLSGKVEGVGFQVRNWLAAATSRSRLASRGADVARAAILRAKGRSFLRGGLTDLPRPFDLVAGEDELPREWGPLNRRLYRMFHSTVLPTILRNFDRISMAHGIEVRMPFMDWRLVTYTMALPAESKASGGYTKMIARRAMEGGMPEKIRMGRRKVGFNSPMPEWLNGPLADWSRRLLERKVPAFTELVDETRLQNAVQSLSASKTWDWDAVGRIWPYLNMKWMLARL